MSKHSCQCSKRRLLIALVAAVAAWVCVGLSIVPRVAQWSWLAYRGRGGAAPAVEPPAIRSELTGTAAPDLQLPRLNREAGSPGATTGEVGSETVRLASFRGKRIVCLFLSSYT